MDHQLFLDAAERLQHNKPTNKDVQTISNHAEWLRKFIDDKRRASASRTRFGAHRKPDNEVTPDALRKRAAREKAKHG